MQISEHLKGDILRFLIFRNGHCQTKKRRNRTMWAKESFWRMKFKGIYQVWTQSGNDPELIHFSYLCLHWQRHIAGKRYSTFLCVLNRIQRIISCIPDMCRLHLSHSAYYGRHCTSFNNLYISRSCVSFDPSGEVTARNVSLVFLFEAHLTLLFFFWCWQEAPWKDKSVFI